MISLISFDFLLFPSISFDFLRFHKIFCDFFDFLRSLSISFEFFWFHSISFDLFRFHLISFNFFEFFRYPSISNDFLRYNSISFNPELHQIHFEMSCYVSYDQRRGIVKGTPLIKKVRNQNCAKWYLPLSWYPSRTPSLFELSLEGTLAYLQGPPDAFLYIYTCIYIYIYM